MKTSKTIRVTIIQEQWSLSQNRRLILGEKLNVSEDLAEIWIRQGVARKTTIRKPKNNSSHGTN